MKQIDYDYSLLDIEETPSSPLLIGEGQGEVSEHNEVILSDSEESISHQTSHSEPKMGENPQETLIKEQNPKDDEDHRNRAKIFRSF